MKVTVNGKAMDTSSAEYREYSARRQAFLQSAGQDIFTGIREGNVHIGLMTDKVFLGGLSTNGDQFETAPEQGDYYRAVAEAKGQSVKGKVYLSSLAEYPGDPKAWVDGRGDVRRVLEDRGWNSRGAVNVKSQAREAPERIDVAEDIVDRQVALEVAADPGLSDMDPGELRHEVKEKLVPHWRKR